MQIKETSQIVSGYTFRGAIESDTNGNAFVFQARDIIQGEAFLDIASLSRIYSDTSRHASLLRKNDVLLVARGMKSNSFKSTTFASDANNVIASSSIYIIRITSRKVLPEYVSHYLNSKAGQIALSKIISGSYIGALPRRELGMVDIPIPPLDTQRILIHLYENIRQQQKILSRTSEIKENIINASFSSLATK